MTGPVATARGAAASQAARRLARIAREATQLAAQLPGDGDVVATLRIPQGDDGGQAAAAVADAASTGAVTVVVLRNTTAPHGAKE